MSRLSHKAAFAAFGSVAVLALFVFAAFSQTASDPTTDYVGSATCVSCHEKIYSDYLSSGHPLKIQKVDGTPPAFPSGTSPGVPLPPKGMEWSDVSYVIGGYGWKARFMDNEGYILTGPEHRQFNLANDNLGLPAGWSGYDAEKAPRKPYTCGACHTTGWNGTGPDGPHQDGLPGIHGTWQETGVTCEACHGPGAAHAASPAQQTISTEPNCAACHIRGDVTQIDASNGLIRHHEQYEDLLASPHRALGCMACHDPHKSTKYQLGGYMGQKETCLNCHQAQSQTIVEADAHRDCMSCHMPYAGKSAVSTLVAFNGGTVPRGDIRSHIFRVSPDPNWKMFTDDEKFVRLDEQGHALLSLEYACLSCHVDQDKAWAARNAGRIHGKR